MPVFLKLVPWKYLAYVAVLLGAVFFVYHRGELRIEKKDAALRAAAVALNTASEHLAEIKEISIGQTYEKIILQSAVPDAPGLVCHNSAPVQSEAPDYRPEAPGKVAQLPDGGFNPSGAILTLLRNDDAQISGLIDTVLNLRVELEGQTQ